MIEDLQGPYDVIDYELERYLSSELRIVNKCIPFRRKLSEILKEKYPYVLCSDGGIHMFRSEEIKELLKYVGTEVNELYLPIILELRVDLGSTVAVVKDRVASIVLSKMLNVPYSEGGLYLYPRHLAELRRRIGTLIYYLMSISSE